MPLSARANEMFTLLTDRLLLRHFHSLDTEPLWRVFGDAEVMRFGDGVQTKAWVQTWLQTCLERYYPTWGFGPYAVVEQRSQDVIGYCGGSKQLNSEGVARLIGNSTHER